MTMTIDANQQRFGPLHFEPMSSYQNHPHFTNPWVPSSSSSSAPSSNGHPLFVGGHDGSTLPHLNLSGLAKHPQHPQHNTRPSTTSSGAPLASYGSIPVTAASAGSTQLTSPDVYGQQNLLSAPQDLLSLGANRMSHPHHPTSTSAGYDATAYTTAPAASPVTATYAASPTYSQMGYVPAPIRPAFVLHPEQDDSRRYSQHLSQQPHRPDDRKSFQDALEASHGMLSMSQETPRNIYDVRARQTAGVTNDGYGFPTTHSNASSVSNSYSSGYYGSVDGSVSDYSTAGSDIESLSGRTLSRPVSGMMSSQPPAPQSMMSSFSSKVASSTQKKHKCKVCDKRFTRPSSLQTHMYSHTGEKPFSCEVEGCGRQFSVVSNLRRHRKVHKNQQEPQTAETPSEAGSEDHQSE